MFDPHTNKFRGFGFIAFEENSSADKAREQLQGFELDGKKITIEKVFFNTLLIIIIFVNFNIC